MIQTVALAEVRSVKLSISNAVFSANATPVFFADFPRSFCCGYEFQNAEPASFVYPLYRGKGCFDNSR